MRLRGLALSLFGFSACAPGKGAFLGEGLVEDLPSDCLAEESACDGLDEDCDGQTDEGLTTTSWADADGDRYGDPAAPTEACSPPAGTVDNALDCDDADPAVFPGRLDACDARDSDCDGAVDEDCEPGEETPPWAGTGADGALVVTGTTVLDDAWPVVALGDDSITLTEAPDLAPGDEVLLLHMFAGGDDTSAAGAHEWALVEAVEGRVVRLRAAIREQYGPRSNDDLADQALQLVRVAQYSEVTVAAGALLTARPWDGATGGVLAFRATGAVEVAEGGLLSVEGLGYAGGNTGLAYDCDAYQGESYAGTSAGGFNSASGVYANWTAGAYLPNHGGGGAMITGGGGEHAGGATAGEPWSPGYPEAAAGLTYGQADLGRLFLGSGGGGVWNGTGAPGPGGAGGGLLFIGAQTVRAEGEGAITASGETTRAWAQGSWTYGAGGGAGGTLFLIAQTLLLGEDSLQAEGGQGEQTHERFGGDGGEGRVRLDFISLNGAEQGTDAAIDESAAVSLPAPGWSAAPG